MYKTLKGYKTIAFSALVAGFGAAHDLFPMLKSAMTPERYSYAFVAIGIVSIMLRTVTDSPVGKKEKTGGNHDIPIK